MRMNQARHYSENKWNTGSSKDHKRLKQPTTPNWTNEAQRRTDMKISSDAKFTICENKPQRYANSERLMNQKIGMNMKRTNIKCAKNQRKALTRETALERPEEEGGGTSIKASLPTSPGNQPIYRCKRRRGRFHQIAHKRRSKGSITAQGNKVLHIIKNATKDVYISYQEAWRCRCSIWNPNPIDQKWGGIYQYSVEEEAGNHTFRTKSLQHD